jgi:zinc protease
MKLKSIIPIIIILCSVGIYSQNNDTLQTDPVNITARAVINKYIYAIGGMDKFKSIKDRTTVMTGTAMGQPIKIIIKQKYPDKLFQDMKAGEVDQLLYYSNGIGTMVIGDKKITLEGKELERLKVDATMQFLLDPESYGVKSDFMGIECLDSTDCLVIRYILPSGIRWFQYYSEETGLKIKETKEIQTNQGLFEQETRFSDYREVEGIKFPFSITQYFGNQEIDLAVDSIEINTGLSDKIFEVPE